MTLDPQDLLNGYLDATLSMEEHVVFEQWLQESRQHQQRFASAVLLHDRLRGELLAMSATPPVRPSIASEEMRARSRRRFGSVAAMFGAVCTFAVVLFVLWQGLGDSNASAAVVELDRLISASAEATDRTFQISVENVALPRARGDRHQPLDGGRPPKPPLDGAVVHVRSGNCFVLIRNTLTGEPFITGSNGRTSWAVRPDGPVRVSADLTRFNRDLPGHEFNMSLINIEDGLEQLRSWYDIQLLPIENGDAEGAFVDEPLRLLVAVKKKGFRGPRRVEVTYAVTTGQVRQMRFVEMPYGPEMLTVRLTLVDMQSCDESFFDHESHHTSGRIIEKE
ncbi:MAG: hypothetical protein R3C01_10145 [Planctomycetaceae bacterium]